MFLQERLNGQISFLQDESAEKRLRLWQKKAGGSGGEEAFRKRLAAEDISLEKALATSGTPVWDDDSPLPIWTLELNRLLDALPTHKEAMPAMLCFDLDRYLQDLRAKIPDKESVVEEVRQAMLAILPFVYYGEKELLRKMAGKSGLFSQRALADMSVLLANGLHYLTHKTLAERLNIFILHRESFGYLLNLQEEDRKHCRALFTEELLAGGWREILLEYPLLARFIIGLIQNWLNNMEELADNLQEDREVLVRELNQGTDPGQVQSVSGNISDAHNKGKGVMILKFASGIKIVYKPRNLAIDTAYYRLVQYLKMMNFPCELKAPLALQAGNHGWIEFIEYRELTDLDEAKSYYRRAGALLCLVYVLGGNDFHGENIIASGGQPVLIDLETIISYKMLQFNEDSGDMKEIQNLIDLIQESVLGIGFLPAWLTAGDICVDFSALTGGIPSSIPSYQQKGIKVFGYEEELSQGFREAYDFLVAKGDILLKMLPELFRETMLRVILRPTNFYVRMLYQTLSPQFLQDGFLYSLEIERFAPAYLINIEAEKVKRLWPIFLAEQEALEGRDIPIFYGHAGQRHLQSGEAILTADHFADSALDKVHNKLTRMNGDDRERQLEFIRESLAICLKGCHGEGKRAESTVRLSEKDILQAQIVLQNERKRDALLAEVRDIYEEIMDKAIPVDGQHYAWISYQHDLIHEKTFIGQTTATLYDGVFGIALLAAAFHKVTGEEKQKQDALDLLKPWRQSLRNQNYPLPVHRIPAGLGNGLGGMIQSLLLIGDYTGDRSCHEDARYLVEQITPEQISKDKHLNILNGTAGLIQGLLSCYQKTGHHYSLELAKLCGRHIQKNRAKVKKAGLAYGRAGLAFGLAELYQITGNIEILEGLQELTAQAASSYTHLKVQDKSAGIGGSICHGLAGLGIMVLALHKTGEAQRTEAGPDLEKIIEEVGNYPLEYGDHFCCGNSGRMDFLLGAALRLDRPELRQEVNRKLSCMLSRKNTLGYYQIDGTQAKAIANPSFFHGLAGIGYVLLRSLEPEKIYSLFN